MYRVTITHTDGTYCESMRFASLTDARAWAKWQQQTMGRIAHISSLS
jgi:hypothetical protein